MKEDVEVAAFVGGSNNLDRGPCVRRATGDGGGLHHDIIADVLWSAQKSHRQFVDLFVFCSVSVFIFSVE